MPKKVLIVDDNQDAINILSAIIKKGGYLATVAKDGVEAIQKIKDESPALILLDIMMPKMDGFEVCQTVKSDAETKHIPILMVTAKTDPASRARGLKLGASDYLMKPIHPAETLRKVKEYLDETTPPQSPSGSSPISPLLSLIFWRQWVLDPF